MQAETNWLSADWGTTNFRLRLVAGASMQVLAEVSAERGIAAIFQNWKEQTATIPAADQPAERFDFYKKFLLKNIRELERKIGSALDGAPLVLSGMATSSIGMILLAYQALPCPVDGSGLIVELHQATADFPFPLALVSGMRNENDVMRGEETMLIGAAATENLTNIGASAGSGNSWYVFPGTHSKHLLVQNGQLTGLRTYMTGEIFALLAEKSILSASVEKIGPTEERQAFLNGLKEGWQGRLTHSVFSIRAADLLGKSGKKANYSFLSGLLIGHELRDLENSDQVILVGSGTLQDLYRIALTTMLPETIIRTHDARTALIRGQWTVAEKLFPE